MLSQLVWRFTTLLALAVVNLVPLLGGLIVFTLLLAGTGAMSRQLYAMYKA